MISGSYLPRLADAEIEARLGAAGAVMIEGARACGKTATARHHAASEVLLDIDANARRAIEIEADTVLRGEVPRLIDEWQIEPEIWNHVRRAVDERGLPGQFILTGSAVPADDVTRHTGAGRISRLRMRPMSLFESGGSDGAISLAALFSGEGQSSGDRSLRLGEVLELISRGGWPALRSVDIARACRSLRDYLDDVSRVDIEQVSSARHNPEGVRRLMQSYARNVSTEVSANRLAADAGGADGPLDGDTVRAYIAALSRVFVTEELPAWSTHLRSRHTLRKAPKRHFVDPSLAVAALGSDPDRLAEDLELAGMLFESLAIRDLRIYAQPIDARVFHYRDSAGLEVDAIVETRDGRWAAFEVKLGGARIDEAAANLLRFRERVDTGRRGTPMALVVLTSSGFGYLRPDGVQVVPLAALGP